MKKQYSKPGIIIEDFRLSQNIASCWSEPGGNSLGKPSHWDKSSCGWDMGNMIVWTTSTKDCTSFDIPADGEIDGVCYNNPSGGNSIFSS